MRKNIQRDYNSANLEETDSEFLDLVSVPRMIDVSVGHLQLVKAELTRIIELIDEMQVVYKRRKRKFVYRKP